MKRLLLIFASLLILQTGFSYSWENFGPENINAKGIKFFHEPFINSTAIIISDSGFYLVENNNQYEFVPLIIKDACAISSDKIAVLLSEGSYSDGIWSFDMGTQELSNLKYCYMPTFIMYNKYDGDYYCGFEGGLNKSSNGFSWSEIPYFDEKNCIGIAFYDEQIAINVLNADTQIYFSTDSGSSWSESSNHPQDISAIDFYTGHLFGIVPGNSYSSGLWVSYDSGENWEVSFYSLNMSDVFNLNDIELFLGWESPFGDYEGVGLCDPFTTPPELIMLNEGLPNTSVKKINGIELLEYPVMVFVCTDNGVYVTTLFDTGIDENKNENNICIYPDPVSGFATIEIPYEADMTVYIYNSQGIRVDKINAGYSQGSKTIVNWDKGDLPAGVYYLVVKSGNESLSKKFIIL